MPAFLNIPLEMRSCIIHLVINAKRELPTEYTEDRKPRERDENPRLTTFCAAVLYEMDVKTYVTSSYGLVGTNKQLNYETKMVLAMHSLVCKMDITFLDSKMLYPSWTCLPAKTDIMDVLEVRLRSERPGDLSLQGWNGGSLFWSLYCVLDHFCRYGVQGLPADSRLEGNGKHRYEKDDEYQRKKALYVVRTLDLNFIDPDDFCPLLSPGKAPENTRYDCDDKRQHDQGTCNCSNHTVPKKPHLGACTLQNPVISGFRILLGLETMIAFSESLYTAVGKIRFRVNGELRTEIDLTDWLLHFSEQWNDSSILERRRQVIRIEKRVDSNTSASPIQHTPGVPQLPRILPFYEVLED